MRVQFPYSDRNFQRIFEKFEKPRSIQSRDEPHSSIRIAIIKQSIFFLNSLTGLRFYSKSIAYSHVLKAIIRIERFFLWHHYFCALLSFFLSWSLKNTWKDRVEVSSRIEQAVIMLIVNEVLQSRITTTCLWHFQSRVKTLPLIKTYARVFFRNHSQTRAHDSAKGMSIHRGWLISTGNVWIDRTISLLVAHCDKKILASAILWIISERS